MEFIRWLKDLSKKDVVLVGGKAANLGEMVKADLPVPNAFVVTAYAYKYFVEKNKLVKEIRRILKKTNFEDPKNLEESTKKIRELIINSPIPREIENEIINAYKLLSQEFGESEISVAIRSSATAEDIPEASFAGLQLTLLNIRGEKNVLDGVKQCWSSLFTPRATFYRYQKKFEHEKVYIAVVVQKQLGILSREEYENGEYKAGVGFTIHPSTGEKNKIVIESSYGQGESVVSGA
ncbi:MAG: PEP/pyruvate-binding domain-containing protein, partial [Candidatus Aenigmarchaeota archaeon]|nr:phosphoenolpyruvate synthase [Candidatus Aenigmarchaeota archaeon]MDW8149155.1 PEP/pyruvate-binding domain-containing protein [Candidatus Aenigmarchaeota archaeon]